MTTPAKSSDTRQNARHSRNRSASPGAILALDTCPRSHFSIALRHLGEKPRQRIRQVEMGAGGRGHVEILAPAIAALMAAEGLAFSDLSLIAVNVGPGSFSGVRAGCASARALAQAASLPVVGITVMELWAQRAAADWAENCATDDVLLTALPAGANLFMQAFRLHHGAPVAMTAAASHSEAEALSQCREFTSLVLLGGGAETLAAALAKNTASESRPGPSWRVPRLPQPDAILLATLASQREPAADFPIPVYMRPPDARLPLEKPPGE